VYWSWVLMFAGVTGMYLVGLKLKAGWVVNILGHGLWITYAIQTEQYGFLVSSAVYITVFTRNWFLWSREEKELKTP
jgi:lipid-A-disaccharide synthase-like uncharacterized protein